MPYSKISTADKQRLIAAYENGNDYQDLARVLGIHRTTAYSIVRRYLQSGVVERPRGGFRGRKMNEEMLNTACCIVEENNALTLLQINEELRRRLPSAPSVTITTLCSALRGSLYRIKKLETVPYERNSDAVKDARLEFANWLMATGIHQELIFIDEAGFNLWTARTRGRARIGEPAVRVVAGRRGQNLTTIFAVSNERGLLAHDIFAGGTKNERFNTFLTNVIAFIQRPTTFLFDNASCHGNITVSHDLLTIRKLPPYSPFLNIVEHTFSEWKASVKRRLAELHDELIARTHQQRMADFATVAEVAIGDVTENGAQKAQNYFRLVQGHIPQCLTRSDILL